MGTASDPGTLLGRTWCAEGWVKRTPTPARIETCPRTAEGWWEGQINQGNDFPTHYVCDETEKGVYKESARRRVYLFHEMQDSDLGCVHAQDLQSSRYYKPICRFVYITFLASLTIHSLALTKRLMRLRRS
jgi:hypothetical protein